MKLLLILGFLLLGHAICAKFSHVERETDRGSIQSPAASIELPPKRAWKGAHWREIYAPGSTNAEVDDDEAFEASLIILENTLGVADCSSELLQVPSPPLVTLTSTLVSTPVTSKSKRKRPRAPRKFFPHRGPFSYKVTCSCKANEFHYVAAAIKHARTCPETQNLQVNQSIRVTNESPELLKEFPFTCSQCPFRASKFTYLGFHMLSQHR